MPDPAATNLNGAIRDSVEGLQAHQQRIIDANYCGIVTSGYLVVYTAGADTAGRATEAQAAAAVEAARTSATASCDERVAVCDGAESGQCVDSCGNRRRALSFRSPMVGGIAVRFAPTEAWSVGGQLPW